MFTDKARVRKVVFFLVSWLLAAVVVQGQAANTNELRNALQLKLDEWHKAGSFPGATLGVVLANGESFGLVGRVFKSLR